jgi:thiosulfate dehydrogenase
MQHLRRNWLLYLIVFIVLGVFMERALRPSLIPNAFVDTNLTDSHWVAPSLYTDETPTGKSLEELFYGQDLIANTANYLGPKGSVAQITNGMDCQSCHLDAGRRAYGNNFGAVAANYPRFSNRSGAVESIARRVNDCFERSLNGRSIDTSSREMKAIVAYIQWLGKDVPKGRVMRGVGISQLTYLDRPASPENGKQVYHVKCVSCHGVDGQGIPSANGIGYTYPPLWGAHSYNTGAGLYRLSRLAGYIKDNMPLNQTSHQQPALTDEECWDVAAFINTQPHPSKDISRDWPDMSKKPVDHPFGPYADGFTEQQHKFGPFKPIIAAKKR